MPEFRFTFGRVGFSHSPIFISDRDSNPGRSIGPDRDDGRPLRRRQRRRRRCRHRRGRQDGSDAAAAAAVDRLDDKNFRNSFSIVDDC